MEIRADEPLALSLMTTIHEGNIDELQRLLSSTPDLANARIVDDRGVKRTPLHIAADWPGHFPNGAAVVKTLIAAGANPSARVDGPRGSSETPLHWAASSDDVAVLDALLDGGADIEAPGAIFTGGTAMSDAVVFAQWKAARRLVERGARMTIWQAAALGSLDHVRREITNAFWNACRGGHLQTAEFLLGCGADVNWIGHDQKTPLDVAHESGSEELVQWLRSHGAR